MHKTTEYTSTIIEMTDLARTFNPNLGSYVEHFLNDDFNYSVRLNNNFGIKISRTLVQDFSAMPSVLKESDIIKIAESAWKLM